MFSSLFHSFGLLLFSAVEWHGYALPDDAKRAYTNAFYPEFQCEGRQVNYPSQLSVYRSLGQGKEYAVATKLCEGESLLPGCWIRDYKDDDASWSECAPKEFTPTADEVSRERWLLLDSPEMWLPAIDLGLSWNPLRVFRLTLGQIEVFYDPSRSTVIYRSQLSLIW